MRSARRRRRRRAAVKRDGVVSAPRSAPPAVARRAVSSSWGVAWRGLCVAAAARAASQVWLEFDELEHPPRAPLNVRCRILSQIDDPHRRDFASMTMILDSTMKRAVGTADSRLREFE
jgi:hypothetical protein